MKDVRKISRSRTRTWQGKHRYEHWLVDNQVYFITARVRDKFHAFASEEAKQIFWSKFEQYTSEFGFVPWITTLLDNHYHTIGYLSVGEVLPRMMQRIHGSIAKLVNDRLRERHPEFWRNAAGQEYFDGCIRNEKQARLAYRYTMLQAERARIVLDWRDYAHTRVGVELEPAVARARELKAFLAGVPYKRYDDPDRLH